MAFTCFADEKRKDCDICGCMRLVERKDSYTNAINKFGNCVPAAGYYETIQQMWKLCIPGSEKPAADGEMSWWFSSARWDFMRQSLVKGVQKNIKQDMTCFMNGADQTFTAGGLWKGKVTIRHKTSLWPTIPVSALAIDKFSPGSIPAERTFLWEVPEPSELREVATTTLEMMQAHGQMMMDDYNSEHNHPEEDTYLRNRSTQDTPILLEHSPTCVCAHCREKLEHLQEHLRYILGKGSVRAPGDMGAGKLFSDGKPETVWHITGIEHNPSGLCDAYDPKDTDTWAVWYCQVQGDKKCLSHTRYVWSTTFQAIDEWRNSKDKDLINTLLQNVRVYGPLPTVEDEPDTTKRVSALKAAVMVQRTVYHDHDHHNPPDEDHFHNHHH